MGKAAKRGGENGENNGIGINQRKTSAQAASW